MKDLAHLHDFKVDKPRIYEDYSTPTYAPVNKSGLSFSDLVMVFTDDGIIRMAQYGSDGWWYAEGGEKFGNVTHWYDGYPIPSRFKINYSRYGGLI